MKISMPTRQDGLPCVCPEPLPAQLRRPASATELCVASPLARGRVDRPPDRDVDAKALLRRLCVQLPHVRYPAGRALFRQDDPADAIFFIGSGRLHRTITTEKGDECLVAILGPADFCGEESLTRQPHHTTSAIVVEDAEIVRIDKALMPKLLRDWPELASVFTTYLLSHSLETESALIDQLVGSAEQRLRQLLLRLANIAEGAWEAGTISNVNQEMLAGMIGTTRQRVNYFLNKFRKLGLIDYGRRADRGRILVRATLRQTTGGRRG